MVYYDISLVGVGLATNVRASSEPNPDMVDQRLQKTPDAYGQRSSWSNPNIDSGTLSNHQCGPGSGAERNSPLWAFVKDEVVVGVVVFVAAVVFGLGCPVMASTCCQISPCGLR